MSTRNNSIQQVSTSAPVGAQVGDGWFDPNTNKQYQLLPVNGTSVQWAEVPTSANAYGAVTASPGAWTALQSFLGTSSSLGVALNNLAERVNFVGTGATGTIDYNVTSQSVLYYIGNASSNWIVNFRGSAGASLNSMMAIGQSVTAVLLANQGANAFINNGVRVDGISYTPAWQGGAAPTSGSANGTDLYSYTIVKTNEFSFIVFASRTAHGKPTFVTNVPGVATPSLYEFTAATFSPGGTTGRDGPSLANARTGLTGTGTDQSGQGSISGGAYAIASNATLTTTWQRFTFTGTVATTATQVFPQFMMTPTGTAGANDYFEVRFAVDNISGISLEYGPAQVSPFPHPAQPSATITILPVGA
jgi:hypothetical protein